MDEKARKLAESVLNTLMKDSSVTGMRFFTSQLLLDGPKDMNQEAFIRFPEEFAERSQEEDERKSHQLRGEEVDSIEIQSPWPHLIVNFKSGKVLFLNGKDLQYEPWTSGLTNFGNTDQRWLVVACPGGGLAVWAPEDHE
jgi:hypothetical protein